jgi:hypothetical protein
MGCTGPVMIESTLLQVAEKHHHQEERQRRRARLHFRKVCGDVIVGQSWPLHPSHGSVS